MKSGQIVISYMAALLLVLLPCKVDIPHATSVAGKAVVADYAEDPSLRASLPVLQEGLAEAFDRQAGINSQTHEIERLLHEKVNEERKRQRLKPLVRDPLLADTALLHSLDMAQRGYFSHTNERGEDPSARAKKGGVTVVKKKGSLVKVGIGENIGMMPTGNVKGLGYISSPQDVARAMMTSWMKSKSHRTNILNADYDTTGIGVARDSQGAYYLTQDFR